MDNSEELNKKLEELQTEYSKTKYSKATNIHLGILRAKISKTKKDIIEAGKRKKGSGFFVKKSGDATVALVGFPSAGKSSLITIMTNTKSKIAEFAFTTTTVIPGMLVYNNAKIQIFDLPGIIEGAHIGIGGGRAVLTAAKASDLIVFVVDATAPEQFDTIMDEFRKLDIFINKTKPDIFVHETQTGGFELEINKSGLNSKNIETIFHGFGVFNAKVKIGSRIGEDELIAYVSRKSCYINAIVALNKIDLVKDYRNIAGRIAKANNMRVIPVSARSGANLKDLIVGIYESLNIITVYMKPKFEEGDGQPMVLRAGSTITDLAKNIHTKLVDEFKYAYVDGPSAKFRSQRVGANHVLKNGDTVTLKM